MMRISSGTNRIAFGLVLGLATMSASTVLAQVPPEHVALKGARILPISGPAIDTGTILIERGKITAVGKEVEIPFDARVFDLTGKVVMPGIVNAHTSSGMDVANESRPITPQLSAYDAIDPSQLFFEDTLRLGTTVVHVMPGNNTVIGGLGHVVRPIGLGLAEMTIAEGSFLKIAVTPRSGNDRMLQMAMLREELLAHAERLAALAEQRYEEDLEKKDERIDVGPADARTRGVKLIRAEDITDQDRNLLRLTGGKVVVDGTDGETLFKPLGAFIYCGAAMDVAHAVQFAKDNGFFERLVLVLGTECFKAIDELKAAARPVVLPPALFHREIDPITGEVTETFVPKKIADAGLLFALTPGPDASLPERMLTYEAARCVRYGISRSDALRAITINPAKLLGLQERFGSIEPGKDAHLVVFSGDPLDFNSVVERVFIDGIPAYDRSRDIRIQRLLKRDDAEDEQPE